ncbi:hypothetical protein C8J56DRAFT_1164685 [Mycena floridula]|nr:hypothetical protein C8J56DRAFT_1164685 [Mycena floridula]
MAQVLDKLKLPAFGNVGVKQGWNDADQQSVGSLVSRSRCTLTSVKFRSIWIIHPSLVSFLFDNSSITELALDDVYQEILPLLQCTSTSAILPNLTHFKMSIDEQPRLVIPELFTMVESRFPRDRAAPE